MQNIAPDARIHYRERLSPSLWLLVTVALAGPIIASVVPGYAHPGDAGADLVAAEAVHLAPGERALVATGVRIALPEGYAAFVVPRSGLAAKHGHHDQLRDAIADGDIVRAVDVGVDQAHLDLTAIAGIHRAGRVDDRDPVTRAVFIPVEELPESVRGEGGFGSTGYQAGSHSPSAGQTND